MATLIDVYFLLESPEETLKCKERGKYVLYDFDQVLYRRKFAKKYVCGTEPGRASDARRCVACERHARSSNLRFCIFGLGLSKQRGTPNA